MLKDIGIIIVILIFILAACVFSQWFVLHSTDEMLAAAEPIRNAIANNDWQQANTQLQQVNHSWNKAQKIWKAISDHEDTRDVEISLVDMQVAIQQQDAATAQKELESLLFYLNHIRENEKLYWENIF